MQLVNRTSPKWAQETDEMRWLVEALARELWRLYGKNGTLDWDGVEHYLGRIAERAREDDEDAQVFLISVLTAAKSEGQKSRAADRKDLFRRD